MRMKRQFWVLAALAGVSLWPHSGLRAGEPDGSRNFTGKMLRDASLMLLKEGR